MLCRVAAHRAAASVWASGSAVSASVAALASASVLRSRFLLSSAVWLIVACCDLVVTTYWYHAVLHRIVPVVVTLVHWYCFVLVLILIYCHVEDIASE